MVDRTGLKQTCSEAQIFKYLDLISKSLGERGVDSNYTYGYRSEKAMAPTPVLLPGKSHGRRSLVGCSPRGH